MADQTEPQTRMCFDKRNPINPYQSGYLRTRLSETRLSGKAG